jgi:2-C-methyl-D-erythritol 4-phosphate cytidylyltransferase
MRVTAIILAAGQGMRIGGSVRQQYGEINNKPILVYALEKFERCDGVDDIVIVTAADWVLFCREEIVERYALKKIKAVVAGGDRRQDSVYLGLMAVDTVSDIIVVHDGARPFVSVEHITSVIHGAALHGACTLGEHVYDTVKRCDSDNFVQNTLNRVHLWTTQTPQGFRYASLVDAHNKARKESFTGTDDCRLFEWLGQIVKMIEGPRDNIKITTRADLDYAAYLIKNSIVK